jgi:hypothetical protein
VGNEAKCIARFGKQKARGKAFLESSEIVFRSEDGSLRLKFAFAEIRSAVAADGELRLEGSTGTAILELGANAAEWREKILHPKTRLEKLGIKPNATVALVGNFAEDFIAELRSITKNVNKEKAASGAEHIFFAAETAKALSQVAKLADNLEGAACLWIVYPKGQKQITENHVIASGRESGLKDVKVVGFSPTHTALKFVIPVDKR